MELTAVLDLQGGVVVHGVAGRRDRYRPLTTRIATSTDVSTLCQAFRGLGLQRVYLADLDGLSGETPNWDAAERVLLSGCALWWDCGIRSAEAASRALQRLNAVEASAGHAPEGAWGGAGVVIALETLPSLSVLKECLSVVGASQAIFSLDLRDGQPWTRIPEWSGRSSLELGCLAADVGYRQMIVLDVAAVGGNQGIRCLELVRQLKAHCRELRLTTGGGVRNLADVSAAAQAGCSNVLVATAVHDGRIGREEVVAAGQLG